MNMFVYAVFFFLLPLLTSCIGENVYVVQFRENFNEEKSLHEIEDNHNSYLLSVKNNNVEDARASRIYSYQYSINGFAAVLTPDEASKLSELPEVVAVYKSEPGLYKLQTTRSWKFVGLEGGEKGKQYKTGGDLLSKAKYGQDVIVGLLDTGVWPESESFSDEGMGPVPASWKGICQPGVAFNSSHCNKKIIGARYYLKGYQRAFGLLNDTLDYSSARDIDGHGSHTASTVAGRRVANASIFGLASGTASGGAPMARLAIYKACWTTPDGGSACLLEDMLAGIDDAIRDGVHVMSISIGATIPLRFDEDAIAAGALHAAKKNIVISCAAGNYGPDPGTLSNYYPWVITVGASSLDREFEGSLALGNGMKFRGQITPYGLEKKHPLVYAAEVVAPGVAQNETALCLAGSLVPEKVEGKIVMCLRGANSRIEKGAEVKRAGGAGLILGNTPEYNDELQLDFHVVPAAAVSSGDANLIIQYINSTKNPMAIIKHSKTLLHAQPAPYMVDFSSRGPNPYDPNILKPDITAPGLDILAAWSEGNSLTKFSFDKRFVKYNLVSGTSMATPHVAAVAALLKAVHPSWSSATIRSAIMTTAGLKNNKGMPITDQSGNNATPFMFGAGHFRPTKAADPGLVYDASYEDYLLYLCSIGITKADPTFTCPQNPPSPFNLNYPSLAIPKLNGTLVVNRTVTNVGGGGKNVYFFTSEPPIGISVKASPSVLVFDHVGQKQSFTIQVSAKGGNASQYLKTQYGFGWYTWKDGVHSVRSPMAIALA